MPIVLLPLLHEVTRKKPHTTTIYSVANPNPCAVKLEKVCCTKMCHVENCERSGKQRRSESRSVPKNTEGRSSFLRRTALYVGVGFGTTGVERCSKINAQSHGMR
jgi:hypothetical protein